MIHLKSIRLVNFKGISRFSCSFDDLTVLAGLNNSGKTTILQALYLLMGSLPKIAAHQHIDHADARNRTISLDASLSPLGLRDSAWLLSLHTPDIQGTISGLFRNGLRVELGVRGSGNNFTFTLSQEAGGGVSRASRELVAEIGKLTAAFLTPPGEVPSREALVTGDQYDSYLREGRGAQYWRNGIWWGIQGDGFESFAPVQKKILNYFPDIELLLPTLSKSEDILIKYKEREAGPLDIAQSGGGLRTFLALARILDQSPAEVILLDEPDAHLHASQQTVILDLLLDAASQRGRQVILASHSPEIITRVPSEGLRWLERGTPEAEGGEELSILLERLGAAPNAYIARSQWPDILIYVEGVTDRPVIESLVRWCRRTSGTDLPSTMVVPHRDGRFEGPTLQGISRTAREFTSATAVVGIRDLDWYYSKLPEADASISSGDGWSMITLPCKEIENLLCDPEFLCQAYEDKIPRDRLQSLLDEESASPELVQEWRYLLLHQIRNGLPPSNAPPTKEKEAEAIFSKWECDPATRRRFVAGKELLRRVKNRIRREFGQSFYPARAIETVAILPPLMLKIAQQIFPTMPLPQQPI